LLQFLFYVEGIQDFRNRWTNFESIFFSLYR